MLLGILCWKHVAFLMRHPIPVCRDLMMANFATSEILYIYWQPLFTSSRCAWYSHDLCNFPHKPHTLLFFVQSNLNYSHIFSYCLRSVNTAHANLKLLEFFGYLVKTRLECCVWLSFAMIMRSSHIFHYDLGFLLFQHFMTL